MNNYILEYYQAITDGSIIAGKWIIAWYKLIVEGLEEKRFFYNHKKAITTIKFIETFCHHHKGKLAPQTVKLELWQKAFFSVVFGIVDAKGHRQFNEVILVVGRKNGKAVSLDTEIATPNGWVKMEDIKEGDLVFGQDGKPSRVLYVSPIFNKPMYKVTFEDGETVKASADHIWTVQTKKSRSAYKRGTDVKNVWKLKPELHENEGWFSKTTEEMANDFYRIRLDKKGKEYKYRVPLAKAVEYPEKELTLDPYTLGTWLGDGTKGTTEITVAEEDLEETKSNLEKEGHVIDVKRPKERSPKLTIDVTERGKPNKTRTALHELGVLHNKFIPQEYMYSSIEQRTALLQGLMDTDGYCSINGECEFCQKSEVLTDQFRELLASLGIKSSKRLKTIKVNGKECHAYSVHFFVDREHSCFRMARKTKRLKEKLAERMKAKSIVNIERIETEPSKCIMIDNTSHLYLVGRMYTSTHNTLIGSATAERICALPSEYGQEVYFIAPKLDQAKLAYDGFRSMIEMEDEIRAIQKKRRTDTFFASSNTTAAPIAFNAKKSDGLNPSFVLCDEIASWQGDGGLKQYEVMTSALGARDEGLVLSITTAGYVDESIYDELIKRGTAVLNGDSRETKLAPFLYMIDDVSKWNDINEIQKAMPNLGVSVSVDFILEEIAKAEGSLSKKVEFMTKYCNVKQNSSQAWLPTHEINKCSGDKLDLEDFKKHYAVLGIDLSRTTDLTSATCIIQKENDLYVFNHFWLPAEKIEEASVRDSLPYKLYIQRGLLSPSGDNVVDYNDCFNWCKELVEKYKLYPVLVGYDKYNANYLTSALKEYGFHCYDVVQGFNLSPVILETEGLIKDGRLHIGDNDLLKVHLLDTALKFSAEKERCRIVKLNNKAHIDGTASLLCAMTVRQQWWKEYGKRLTNERRN